MKDTEKEIKILLDVNNYNNVIKKFPEIIKVVVQENHYFDTKLFTLKNHSMTLRIREENNIHHLTLKVKKSFENQAVNSLEFNKIIDKDLAVFLICNPQEITPFLEDEAQQELLQVVHNNDLELTYLGSIHNERKYIQGPKDICFELDYTIFPKHNIEYELEIENVSNPLEIINILKTKGIVGEIGGKGKYKRFIKYLTNDKK